MGGLVQQQAVRQLGKAALECQAASYPPVAVLAYLHVEVAPQHGEAWRAFLNRSLPPTEQLQPVFADAAYQKTCPEIDVTRVHRAAQQWIKRHKVAL